MPTLTIPNSFSNDGVIQASEHNANFNAVATLLNSTKLDGDNIQDGSINAGRLASDAVTTAKILDSNVTLAKLAAAVQALLVPAGTIAGYGGSSLPTGWVDCDGSSLLRSSYSALFSAIGTTWGAVDGTHFNVPDLRGRTLIGAGTGSGLTARTLGTQNIGAESNTAVPAHTHPLTSAGLTYTLSQDGGGVGPYNASSGGSAGTSASATGSTGDASVNNMQPSAVVKYMIKI